MVFPRDPKSRILAIIHIALIIALWLIPTFAYNSLPDRIPVHFNLDGQPDRWEDKSGWTLYMLPAVWTVIGGLIFVLLRYRRAFNYPQKDEISKLPEQYQTPVHILNRQFILAVFVVIGAMFVYLEYAIVDSAQTATSSVSLLAVFGPMGLTLVLLVAYLIRVRGVAKEAIAAAKRESW
ncbi:MAG: DUF1648 domain-containing protein [candidate division Zixibacteria bacterium]|nr:DUF1648 domain-containing protein [candidate division Zixibacteria bacterium]